MSGIKERKQREEMAFNVEQSSGEFSLLKTGIAT